MFLKPWREDNNTTMLVLPLFQHNYLSHEIENIGRDMQCVFKGITLCVFSKYRFLFKKAVGLWGRGTPISATYNHPDFLEMLLNER